MTNKPGSPKDGKKDMMQKIAKLSVTEAMGHANVPYLSKLFERISGHSSADQLSTAGKAYKDINKFIGQKAEELAPKIEVPGRLDTVLSESPEKLVNPALVGAGLGGTAGALTDTSEEQTTPFGSTVKKPGSFSDRMRNIATGAGVGAGLGVTGRMNTLSKSNIAQELAAKGPERIQAALKHMSPEQLGGIADEALNKFRPHLNTDYEGFAKNKQLMDEFHSMFGTGAGKTPTLNDVNSEKLKGLHKFMRTHAPTMAKEINLGNSPEERLIAMHNLGKLDPHKIPEAELESLKHYGTVEDAAGKLIKERPAPYEYGERAMQESQQPYILNLLKGLLGGTAAGTLGGIALGPASIPLMYGGGALSGLLSGHHISTNNVENAVRGIMKEKGHIPLDNLKFEMLNRPGMTPELADKLLGMVGKQQFGPNAGEILRRSQM